MTPKKPKKKTQRAEREAKARTRLKKAVWKQTGYTPKDQGWPRTSHSAVAAAELDFALPAFELLRKVFRPLVSAELRQRTLTGKLRTQALPPARFKLTPPNVLRVKQPRDSAFPEVGKLLLFALRYWQGQWTQKRLADAYGMSQPQVRGWVKFVQPLLVTALRRLAATDDDLARAVAAPLLPLVLAPRPRGRRRSPPAEGIPTSGG